MNEQFAAMVGSAQFIGGPVIARLEARLKEVAGVQHAICCANGTDALQLGLRALGVGRGDIVLVPNVTFWATFEAVVNVGADPMTLDIDLADGGVDVTALEEAISRARPKAVILAHLYGWASGKLGVIRELCQRHGVNLLEDGAQCFGTEFRGASIYGDAQLSTTSFYPAKVLGAAGDGGAVFTNDPNLADRVRRLANHGRTAHYGYAEVGWNSRLDVLQAVFLEQALEHLPARLASRRWAAGWYRERLPGLGIEQIVPPSEFNENGYCNVCLIREPSDKQTLEAALAAARIGFGNIYPGVLSSQEGALAHSKGHFGGRNGEVLCGSVLNLPLFPYMSEAELSSVLEVVQSAVVKFRMAS